MCTRDSISNTNNITFDALFQHKEISIDKFLPVRLIFFYCLLTKLEFVIGLWPNKFAPPAAIAIIDPTPP